MGVSYFVLTLNDEVANWLRENNIPLPLPLPTSRLPTLGELKGIVEHLDGYAADIVSSPGPSSVDIEVVDRRGRSAGWSTTIWTRNLKDKTRKLQDDDTIAFTFHKGSPELAVLIVEKLTHICGPLILCMEGLPLLVTEDIDIQPAVDKWLSY